MTYLPFVNVFSHNHLAAFVFGTKTPVTRIKDPNDPHQVIRVVPDIAAANLVRLEVYTGWIVTNFAINSGTVKREEFVSFLPIGPDIIHAYHKDDLIDSTVMVTTSSVADDDDEANVAAVDKASVALEHQNTGDPLARSLILRATVAAACATVHTICYQVTVLTKIGAKDLEEEWIGDRGKRPYPY